MLVRGLQMGKFSCAVQVTIVHVLGIVEGQQVW